MARASARRAARSSSAARTLRTVASFSGSFRFAAVWALVSCRRDPASGNLARRHNLFPVLALGTGIGIIGIIVIIVIVILVLRLR
jgi:hypothetical protein